jgi:8-oxo-dGTP diphosphatase
VIEVLVGIVRNAAEEILIQKRPDDKPLGGYWEFPGGKREANETLFNTLVRELREELAIVVEHADPWQQMRFDYPEHSVLLHIWQVTAWHGTPRSMEGQAFKFAPLATLQDFRMLAANDEIITALTKMQFEQMPDPAAIIEQ